MDPKSDSRMRDHKDGRLSTELRRAAKTWNSQTATQVGGGGGYVREIAATQVAEPPEAVSLDDFGFALFRLTGGTDN